MSITIHAVPENKGKDKLGNHRFAQIWSEQPILKKPDWLKITVRDSQDADHLKNLLRTQGLVTVCQEASCPNLNECYSAQTATFMIMGDKCTRRCSFCDVAQGRPEPLNPEEPKKLAETIALMKLKYVVITSVDRDDLKDSGAAHFAACIDAIKSMSPHIKVEVLVPDFRFKQKEALAILNQSHIDVFNHNIETVPRLYKEVRLGSDYQTSLNLLAAYKELHPDVPTKSGIMLGLGETNEEVLAVMDDLRSHGCTWLTLGQYLQPSKHHIPVQRYVPPHEFDCLKQEALKRGFLEVASGPFIRSSYHADDMAKSHAITAQQLDHDL